MKVIRHLFLLSLFLLGPMASAEIKLKIFEKIAVFPIEHAATNVETQKALDDSWWDLRELLTIDKRFSVATQLLLQSRQAFQPRGALSIHDAIFLAQAVDAEALVTMTSKDQTLFFRVYWAETGDLLWSSETKLNVVKLEKDQIRDIVKAAGEKFLKHVPFDGHQFGDIVRGSEIRTKAIRRTFSLNQGDVREGDVVEWIEVVQEKAGVPFLDKPILRVNAQGKVTAANGDQIDIVVNSLDTLSKLKNGAMIRFPRLAQDVDESGPQIDARNLAKNRAEPRANNVFLAAIFHFIAIALLAF